MRASRAVALSALTIGLTVGGIGAAAADAATGAPSSNYVTDTASGSGSVSSTARGVTVDHNASGVTAGGHAYDFSSHLKVDVHGVTHCYQYSSSHTSTPYMSGHDKYGHEGTNGNQQYGQNHRGHGQDDEGLLTDALEDLL